MSISPLRRRPSSTSRSWVSRACPRPGRSASPPISSARPAAARSPPSAPPGSASRRRSPRRSARTTRATSCAPRWQRDGIHLGTRRSPRTPTTVVMPVDGDRSMVTVDPGVRASAADVAALEPRAVALSLDQLYCVPPGAAAYVTCGDDDARAFARRPPAKLAGARAPVREQARGAHADRGRRRRGGGASRSARSAERVIVTLGERGRDGARRRPEHVRARRSRRPLLDTTGAGDLLVAAYIWGDLRGASPEECLRWAVLYAGLSIATPTGVGGAVTRGAAARGRCAARSHGAPGGGFLSPR